MQADFPCPGGSERSGTLLLHLISNPVECLAARLPSIEWQPDPACSWIAVFPYIGQRKLQSNMT